MEGTAEKEKNVYDVPLEGIEGFRKAMKDMIGNLIVEISQFACMLYDLIYVKGETPEVLIKQHPESEDMIRIMSEIFAMMKDSEKQEEI